MANEGKEFEAQLLALTELMEVNRPLGFRILMVRFMMSQRNITADDLVPWLDYNRQWVIRALRYSAVPLEDKLLINGKTTWESAHDKLDLIEDAITQRTRELGGVYAASGTTNEFVVTAKDMLAGSFQQAREDAGGNGA